MPAVLSTQHEESGKYLEREFAEDAQIIIAVVRAPLSISEGEEGTVVVRIRLSGFPMSINRSAAVGPFPVVALPDEPQPDEVLTTDVCNVLGPG